MHDGVLGLKFDRIERAVGHFLPKTGGAEILGALDLDRRSGSIALGQDLLGHVNSADQRQREDGENHPQPISDDAKILAEMKGSF
jgi:hypothetical protein